MNLIGFEEIVPYKNFYEYKLYLYDDVIEIGNMDKYVCDVKFIKIEIDDVYREKGFGEIGYVIVENINMNIEMTLEQLKEKIQSFIIDEIPMVGIAKTSINVIFSLKK